MATKDEATMPAWLRIAEAFAGKESSSPEEVIQLVTGLRAELGIDARAATTAGAPDVTPPAPAPLARKEPSVAPAASAPEPTRRPAVQIEKAVTDELVYCLECGRGMKMLKRHLGSTHGLTPHEYKARWDLPEDFPITAPNYTAAKSDTAKAMDFGKSNGKTTKTTTRSKAKT